MGLKDRLMAVGLVAFFFVIYLTAMSPWVAPYRDAGEMASVHATLGVAHPPGYPLYTLAGRVFQLVPWGTPVYKANLFSALCAALALGFLFLVMRVFVSASPAFLTCVLYGFSIRFFELALVSEMYTMGILMLTLCLWAFFKARHAPLFYFLFALTLGVRMDFLLLLPLFTLFLWFQGERKTWGVSAVAFVSGVSIFLVMWVRSCQNPALDWGNPDTLTGLFNSMSRRSYGGTLDRLSLSYRWGENWLANMGLYGHHVARSFHWVGGIGLLLGVGVVIQKRFRIGQFFIFLFLVTGPVFLFLANMPPNPHAVAIVEASFPLPDVFLCFLMVFGFEWAFNSIGKRSVLFFGLLGLSFFQGSRVFAEFSKRHNFFARDYETNLSRSFPSRSIVALHKDVQSFTFFYSQLVARQRLDVGIVATGLSRSQWYWPMMSRWGLFMAPAMGLTTPADYVRLLQTVAPHFVGVGLDVEWQQISALDLVPHGYILQVKGASSPPSNTDMAWLFDVGVNRSLLRYGETADFFSSDLLHDMARAYSVQGALDVKNHEEKRAEQMFLKALSLDPTDPLSAMQIAYLAFTRGDYQRALVYHWVGVLSSEKLVEQAKEFNSLPELMQGVKDDAASACLMLGVNYEKLGDRAQARSMYATSLSYKPLAQTYYNRAVTYWNENWDLAIRDFQACLQLDPNNSSARQYLAVAQQKRQQMMNH